MLADNGAADRRQSFYAHRACRATARASQSAQFAAPRNSPLRLPPRQNDRNAGVMSITAFIDMTIAFARDNAAWAAPVVFVVAFAESVVFLSLLVPGWAILIGIGALIGASGIDFWPVWAAAAGGAAAGDWISWWVGHRFREDATRMWPLSRHPQMVERGRAFFLRFGVWSIVIGRFFGPLRAVVPLMAGIFGMRQLPFQLANVGSALVWALVLLAPTAAALRHFLG